MTLRYEGVRFSDGSCAVRRVAPDPCDRATLTFETVRELEEDVGSAEVTWIADRGSAPPAVPSRSRPPAPGEIDAYFAREHARASAERCGNPRCPVGCFDHHGELSAIRRHDEIAVPPRPAYVGDGHPSVRASRYEPTEETDEP